MHKHGFYWRFVILPNGARKHFGADVISAVLLAVLLMKLSLRAVAGVDSAYNAASFSRFCVGQWVEHFERNSNNLWQFGLARLGVDAAVSACCPAALLRHPIGFAAAVGPADQAFRAVQCGLSQPYPPFGVFRAQLLPGCVT